MTRSSFDVSVLTTGHDVADARLHRLVATLVGASLSVEVVGLGTVVDGPSGAVVRAKQHVGSLRRAARAMLLPWTTRGRVLLVLDPDLAISALLQRCTGRRFRSLGAAGRKVVIDVHEDYAKLLLDRGWARGLRLVVGRLVASVSVRLAKYADLVVVADDHLPPVRSPRRLVLRNLPLPMMLPEEGPLDPSPRALYVGDVRRSRGLREMLALLEGCPSWTLDVVGPVATSDQAWLARWRATSSASDRVTFHGRRPPRQAWRLARGAWAGICLLEPTPAFVAALPSKIYEYVSCGLAVVTSPLPRASALVEDSGAGFVVDRLEAAVAVLSHWAEDPEVVRAHQRAGRSWARMNISATPQYEAFGQAMTDLVRSDKP